MTSDGDKQSAVRLKRRSLVFGGGREFFVVLILLVLCSTVGSIYLSVLVVAIGVCLADFYFRSCFRFGRTVGLIGTFVFVTVMASVTFWMYQTDQANRRFAARLADFGTITVRRHNIFPIAGIVQI